MASGAGSLEEQVRSAVRSAVGEELSSRSGYGRPNGAKFKNSNSITFKDNDHIQRSHSHSRHKN